MYTDPRNNTPVIFATRLKAPAHGALATAAWDLTSPQILRKIVSISLGWGTQNIPLGAVSRVIGTRCIKCPVVQAGTMGHRDTARLVDVIKHHTCRKQGRVIGDI